MMASRLRQAVAVTKAAHVSIRRRRLPLRLDASVQQHSLFHLPFETCAAVEEKECEILQRGQANYTGEFVSSIPFIAFLIFVVGVGKTYSLSEQVQRVLYPPIPTIASLSLSA